MNIKPEKKYYIRVFVTNMKDKSITGLLGWGPFNRCDWGFWTTLDFDQARDWGSRENALHKIDKIINEQQEIRSISDICNTNDSIKFRLSVVEIDINDITIKELDYFDGTITNQITITDKGVSGEKK